MARTASAVLLLAVALACAGAVNAKDTTIIWGFPSALGYAGGVYPDVSLAVGDTLTFSWTGSTPHNIMQIPSAACPSSFTGTPTLAPTGTSGSYVFKAIAPGTTYVACSVGSHCANNGMHFAIIVSGGAPGTAPVRGPGLAPAPGPRSLLRVPTPAPAVAKRAPAPAPTVAKA